MHALVKEIEKNSILSALEKKGTKAEGIAEKVMENPRLLQELFVGLSSKNPRIKFGSAKALRIVSEENLGMLYYRMDFFL